MACLAPELLADCDAMPSSSEKRQAAQEWHGITKALGDPSFTQAGQTYGNIAFDTPDDVEVFVQLAQNYIYEGCDKRDICAHNAKVMSTRSRCSSADVG